MPEFVSGPSSLPPLSLGLERSETRVDKVAERTQGGSEEGRERGKRLASFPTGWLHAAGLRYIAGERFVIL